MSPIFTAGRSGAASCTLESGTRDLGNTATVRRMCCGILHSNRGHPLIPNSLSYAVPTARLPIHCAYAFPFSIRFALYPVRKPLVYSAKLIAGCRPCQGPLLAGWRKIFLPGLNGECIFRILLAWPGRQSRRQKNNRPSVQDYRRGKEKFKSL